MVKKENETDSLPASVIFLSYLFLLLYFLLPCFPSSSLLFLSPPFLSFSSFPTSSFTFLSQACLKLTAHLSQSLSVKTYLAPRVLEATGT